MRVAFDHQIFSLQNYGGISRYFARIAEQMVGAGNDVGIFSPLHRNAYLKELPEGIVRGRWMEKYPPHTARLILAYNRLKGRSEMSRWQPQIVHETYYSRRPSFISEKCPIVLTVYDMIHELYPESFSSQDKTTALKQQAVERADHVICISESTRQDLMRLFAVPESKLSVVHLGVEQFKKVSDKKYCDLPRPYLLYVGARYAYKNFAGLLRAVARSKRLKSDFDIVAFGGGEFSQDEQALMQSLGFSTGQVRQIGGDDALLGQLYEGAKAFVYPSIYEGFGLPPLEAMAHSCPVVSSSTSSMPEIIGNAGAFFDPGNDDEMAVAIERVVYSESEVARLVGLGLERLNHFSWLRCGQETLSIYNSLQR